MSARRATKATTEASDMGETEDIIEAALADDPEPDPEPVWPYEALVIDPPPDTTPEESAEEPAPEPPPEGFVAVTYTGAADVVEFGGYAFRPGQPVYVPSDVAEEVLTLPFETFVSA